MAAAFATLAGHPGHRRTRPARPGRSPVDLPTKGDCAVTAFAVDTAGQQDTSTSGATARYLIYPGDLAPTLNETLLLADRGHRLHRRPDLRQRPGRGRPPPCGAVEVAIVNSAGQYMSSSGTLHQHHRELADGLPQQPGHAGVELLLHHAGDPAGGLHGAGAGDRPARPGPGRARGERARDRDARRPATSPRWPASRPPAARTSAPSTAAASTDENAPTLTYSWNFGNGRTGSGPVPSQHLHQRQHLHGDADRARRVRPDRRPPPGR